MIARVAARPLQLLRCLLLLLLHCLLLMLLRCLLLPDHHSPPLAMRHRLLCPTLMVQQQCHRRRRRCQAD